MKKLIAGLCVLISLTASAQWDTLHTGTNARLKGLSFLNTSVGLTCGYDTATSKGLILYTADAGTTWNSAATTDSVKYKLHAVSYVNANVAIAVGDSGRIMRSVSSGLNWSALPAVTDKHERADVGNVLPYAILQGYTMAGMLLLAFTHPSRYTRGSDIYWVFGAYLAAKIAESLDAQIWEWTIGIISGHTLKHLLAAVSGVIVCITLLRRRPWGLPASA